jgi:Cu(I)/Ag(I) efflux system membrane fusion protein
MRTGSTAKQKYYLKIIKQMKLTSLALILMAAIGLMSNTAVHAADDSASMEPVKSVLDHYLKIQVELTKDSISGIDEHANAIAKAVKGDDMKMLSPDVAKQAETLAQAKDLKAAREAFKPLSKSLIKYLADNKAGIGTYHEAYCPMARASWLQTGKNIQNPYLGTEMPNCGELKN